MTCHSRSLACTDPDVQRSKDGLSSIFKFKFIQAQHEICRAPLYTKRARSVWVCMSIRLLSFFQHHLVTARCERMSAEKFGVDVVDRSIVDDVFDRRERDVLAVARRPPWHQLQTQRTVGARHQFRSTVVLRHSDAVHLYSVTRPGTRCRHRHADADHGIKDNSGGCTNWG